MSWTAEAVLGTDPGGIQFYNRGKLNIFSILWIHILKIRIIQQKKNLSNFEEKQ